MANKNTEDTRTAIDDLNDSLTGIGQKVQNNQKMILWGCIAIIACVCIVLIYFYAVRTPGIQSANEAIGRADMTLALGNDSTALAQYRQVADEYGYEAGNRAALNAAILLYQKGDYQEAINYLSKYSPKEKVIGAAARSLEGDCYVNLAQYDKALDCFRKAVSISDKNPYYTPVFLMKEATVERELKNYAAEAKLYKEIMDLYPNYAQQAQIDLEKYLRRAEIQADKK